MTRTVLSGLQPLATVFGGAVFGGEAWRAPAAFGYFYYLAEGAETD